MTVQQLFYFKVVQYCGTVQYLFISRLYSSALQKQLFISRLYSSAIQYNNSFFSRLYSNLVQYNNRVFSLDCTVVQCSIMI